MLAFELDAQHHDDVGVADGLIHIVGERDAGGDVRELAGQQRGRSAQHDAGAEARQQVHVGAGHAAVRDVADDGDLETAPARAPRSRMVRASSRAWVGCSCVPSPALMMGVSR